MALQARGSLLRRHFFPPIPPIRPWELDRVARAILSVFVEVSVLSGLVVSNRSAELSELSDNRLSGRSDPVVTGGLLLAAVMGVVDLVRVLGRVVGTGGDVRRRAVGFWSLPLQTCKKSRYM